MRNEWLYKYFEVVDLEDAAVIDFAALAGGKYLYVTPTSVRIVSQGNTGEPLRCGNPHYPTENPGRHYALNRGSRLAPPKPGRVRHNPCKRVQNCACTGGAGAFRNSDTR